MKINVAQLLKSLVGTTRSFALEGKAYGVDDSDKGAPVSGTGDLLLTNVGVLARVKAHLSTEEECSRCLRIYRAPVDVAFEEVFYPTVDVVSGAPLAAPPEADPYFIDHNHMLDVEPAVRDYTVMARPLKPLCREDCKGLCPTCGKDQ